MSIYTLRKLAGLAVLCMLMAIFAGCGSSDDDAVVSDAEGQLLPIRLDVVSTGTQAIPAYVMQAKELPAKYGLDLQVHANSGSWGSEWTALKTGDVDVIITAWNYIAMNYAQAPTVAVAPMFGWGNSLIVPEDSEVRGLEDLQGLNLGVYQTTALDWTLLIAASELNYGFDPSESNQVSEAAAGLLGGMLEQGNIDAALSYADTNVILAGSGDYRIVLTVGDILDDLGLSSETPFLFYTFSKQYTEDHPQAVEAFHNMYAEVYDILMTDDDIWVDISRDCFGIENEDAVAAVRDSLRSCILSEDTSSSLEEIQAMLDWCTENGYAEQIGVSELPENFIAQF